MKYFLDTEFLEGKQKSIKLKLTLLIIIGLSSSFSIYCYKWDYFISSISFIILSLIAIYFYTNAKEKIEPTIDLISIGIITEKNVSYYAISKDFNLREAWNRYDIVKDGFKGAGMTPKFKKVYWIKENVLRPIFNELMSKEKGNSYKALKLGIYIKVKEEFNYKNLKKLINKYGKTNEKIAYEIGGNFNSKSFIKRKGQNSYDGEDIEFYAYYGDYDWVVFCWLFGTMNNLPKGFPMYCKDLKQILDNKRVVVNNKLVGIQAIKNHPNYPKENNTHNALEDAIWNLNLYKFLKTI